MAESAMEPQFLDGPNGALFAIHYRPEGDVAEGAPLVIHLPPFAEEMNKSRRMVALQARRLARLGLQVLVFDLSGTGDSAGGFVDATWARWRDDLLFVHQWALGQRPAWISFWCLRAGALLLAELLERLAEPPRHALLWQPQPLGEQVRSQLQRQASLAGDTPADDERWPMEVGGYPVARDLIEPLASVGLERLPAGLPVDWFEIPTLAGGGPSRASAGTIERLRGAGNRIELQILTGDPFWQTAEVATLPALLEATDACYRRLGEAV